MRKIILVFLALCVFFSLMGCTRNSDSEIALPKSTLAGSVIDGKPELRLSGKSLPLPQGIKALTALSYADGSIFTAGLGEDELIFARLEKDGTSQKIQFPQEYQFIYSICPLGENLAVLCGSLPTVYTDAEGNSHFNETVEGRLALLVFSTDGEMISQTPLEQTYNNPSMIFKLMIEKNGEFIIQCQDTLVKISAQGKELARLSSNNPNNWFTSICFYEDRLLAASSERLSNSSQLSIINVDEFKVENTIEINERMLMGLGQADEKTILATVNDGLYCLNMEDYSFQSIISYNQLYFQEDFIGLRQIADGYLFYSRYTDCIYTAVYKEESSERKLIRLATDVDGGCATSLANAFNRSQQNYYVSIESYGSGSSKSLENLKTEIATGNSPHMFAFELSESLKEVEESKIYSDLSSYLSELNIELVDGLQQAMTVNQRLYCLPYTFSIITLTAPESLISNSGLSSDEMAEILKEQDSKLSMLPSWVTKDLLFDRVANYYFDSFIDWENMSCSFNSQEFYELLEFCQLWAGNSHSTSQIGTYLFDLETMQGLQRLAEISEYTEGDYYFVGFPTHKGNGSMFYPELRLYASSQFEPDQGVLEFLRFAMSEEGARANTGPGFYSSKPSFERALTQAQNNGITMLDKTYQHSEKDIAKLTELVTNTKAAYGKEAEIFKIIAELASYYFAEEKTVEEVAELIQSRVSIYLAEKS